MSSKPTTKPDSKTNDLALQKKQNIPVQITGLSIFDNAFALMKERFAEEMRRVDAQMAQFSSDLMSFYGQTTTVQAGLVSAKPETGCSNWDALTSSPLVQLEGDDRILKLQFDVSQFDPTEVTVKLENDVLVVAATHDEKTDGSTVYREYNREFMLPPGTKPEQVVSSLSRDGVLIVQVPLPMPQERALLVQDLKSD